MGSSCGIVLRAAEATARQAGYITLWTDSRFEAETLFKRSLAVLEKALRPEHPSLAGALENYATLLRETGRNAEAEELGVRARAIWVTYGAANAAYR